MTQLKNFLLIGLIAKCMGESNFGISKDPITAGQGQDQTGAYDPSLTRKGMYDPSLNLAGKYRPDAYNQGSSHPKSEPQDNQEDEDDAFEPEVANHKADTLDNDFEGIGDFGHNTNESRNSRGGMEEADKTQGGYKTNNSDVLDNPHTDTHDDDNKSIDTHNNTKYDDNTAAGDENNSPKFTDEYDDITEDADSTSDDFNKSRKKRDTSTGDGKYRINSINDGRYRPDSRNDGKYRPDPRNDGRYRPSSRNDDRSRTDTRNNSRPRTDTRNNSKPHDTHSKNVKGRGKSNKSNSNRGTPNKKSRSPGISSSDSNRRNSPGNAKCLNAKPDQHYLGMEDYCNSKDRDGTDVNQELMVQLVNKLRRTHPLKFDPELAKLAQDHSDDMARCQIFDHNIIPDELMQRREKKTKFGKLRLFENIGFNCNKDFPRSRSGTDDLTREAFQGWEDSEGHRNNMIIDALTHIGVARRGNLWTMVISRRDGDYYGPDFRLLDI